ncbi:hypothetical protein CLOHAE12215_01309 [Clostridium haemolyticum]|uniref:Uncharacterized protein n=1 Tax=Clostridium botulinum D str. 1873 TaxID=592027 RepID=A0A9P2LKB1_CLOBO|nr:MULTISPECIES: hypothetical protein [Clostridium]EES90323.1 hypothetical protein CLG_B2343 [Clostridium phage D-1873]QPW56501.1 hypothetical protein IRP61_10620 [Clostridium botulinum]CAG7839893.1 hypothetical protein CLOHAE12215_01309 [Clostridium haemolyticum]
MILTPNEIKNIIDAYSKENNTDIEKYDLYSIIRWYKWWYPNTILWDCPASSFTNEENKELIIGQIKHWIREYEWDEKYGYKGNYNGCRKFCKECKYACYKYKDELCYNQDNMFCIKMSEKYNILIETKESNNICNYFKSQFEADINLNLDEYFDWLANSWYINNKGETKIQNQTSSIIINNVHLIIPYLIYKNMDIIKDGKVQCSQYYAGKWNSISKKYPFQGREKISLSDVLNYKDGICYYI